MRSGPRHVEALVAHHRQLTIWAENCPENFENRAALVGAEISRIEGRALDAMDLYEQAIRSARANGFVHNEALAYELAARFYAARGFEEFAHMYRRNARDGYVAWGADGKVRQLEQLHPHLRDAPVPASPTATIGAPVEQLDVGTVVKASQAVSGEIVLGEAHRNPDDDRDRACRRRAWPAHPVSRGDEPRIVAEATDRPRPGRGHAAPDGRKSPAELPESVLHYVIRTRESVVLDDASVAEPVLGG